MLNKMSNERKDYKYLLVWRLVAFMKTLNAGGSFSLALGYILDDSLV